MESISTEDLLALVKEVADKLKEMCLEEDEILLGSLHAEALYPSQCKTGSKDWVEIRGHRLGVGMPVCGTEHG